jgi:hypothetical protein
VAILTSLLVIPPVESTRGSSGALLTLTDQTIHVVWQFQIEYDESEMAEEVDGLHEALRHNEDREVEGQLESLITETLRKYNENMTCKNSKILLDTNIGNWAEVFLEFDIEGAVGTDNDFLTVDMSWRDFTVKGKVKFFHNRIEYSFYPRKSLGLQWPFSRDMNEWEIEKTNGSTIFTYVYRDGVEIISNVVLSTVNMTITVPGSAEGEGNYIKIKTGNGSGSSIVSMPNLSIYMNLGIMFVVGVAVFFSALHIWRQRENNIRNSRVAMQVADSPIISEYSDALEKWESQISYARRKPKTVWHGGSLVFRIPNLKFSSRVREHYMHRYMERGE